MSVRGKIGKEEVEFYNAAEEETLRRLLQVTELNSKVSTKTISSIERGISASTDGLEDLNRSSSTTSDGLEELATSSKSTRKEFGNLSSEFKWHAKSLADGFSNINPEQILESSVQLIKDGLEGIGKIVPPLRGASEIAAGALEGIAAVGGAAIGALETFSQRTQELAQSGVILGEGVATFSNQVLESGITIGQYTKLVTENSDALRLIGGSAKAGSMQILSLRKQVIGAEEQFNRLGYSTEEIPNILTDFAESITYTGGTLSNMSSAEVQQRTADYAKNLRIIADITGKDAKARKEASRAAASEALNQNYLLKLQNNEVEGAFTAFGNISSIVGDTLGPQAAKLWSQYNTDVGTALDGQTALWEQANPEVAALLRDYRDKLRAGQLSTEEAQKGIVTALTNIPDEALKAAALRTSEYAYYSALGAKNLTEFERVHEQILGTGQLIKTSIKDLEANMVAAKTTRDEITTGIVNLEATKQQLSVIQSKVAISIATLAGPMMSDALEKLVTKINAAADLIRIETSPEREDKLVETLNKFVVNPNLVGDEERDDMVRALREETRNQLIDEGGISGILTAFQKYSGLALAGDALEDFFGTGRDNATDEQFLEYMKITADYIKDAKANKLLQSDKEIYLQENPDISSRARPVAAEPRQAEDPQDVIAPAQARGDIFPYRPGGKIVTVAEASDEIVAPAKRGSDGKLGLEISGVMLDNSRVLQNLLKVNEGQASLIAGLNSQIANMNSNFEKLVHEQRQANRLAV